MTMTDLSSLLDKLRAEVARVQDSLCADDDWSAAWQDAAWLTALTLDAAEIADDTAVLRFHDAAGQRYAYRWFWRDPDDGRPVWYSHGGPAEMFGLNLLEDAATSERETDAEGVTWFGDTER